VTTSAIGNQPASPGPTYNFTNVTNAQFLQEVQGLGQAGKLSANQETLLAVAAVGGDSVPISGPHVTTAQALSDPTLNNFLTQFQEIDNSVDNHSEVGSALYDSTLKLLDQYQGRPIDASSPPVSTTA
jgi:hypothetical protein